MCTHFYTPCTITDKFHYWTYILTGLYERTPHICMYMYVNVWICIRICICMDTCIRIRICIRICICTCICICIQICISLFTFIVNHMLTTYLQSFIPAGVTTESDSQSVYWDAIQSKSFHWAGKNTTQFSLLLQLLGSPLAQSTYK